MSQPSSTPFSSSEPADAPVIAPTDLSSPEVKALRARVSTACFVGNFVEWFDYAAYGYFVGTVATVFFPPGDRTSALLATWAVFAVSFIVRPLGGIFWGNLGDRIGRRAALAASILIMSMATFCIGLLPTYSAVGLLAPLLLLLVRMVQGFSASGEYAGASTFLVEYAPPGRRGLYASIVPMSTATGLLAGALFAAVLTATMPSGALESWGWRLPFLLAGPMGWIGLYIRSRLEDTPAFRELEQDHEVAKVPFAEMFRSHRVKLTIALGAAMLNAVAFYLLLVYMPTYLSENEGFGDSEAFTSTVFSLIAYIGCIVVTGALSDRFGRRPIMLAASVFFVITTVPAFMLLDGATFAMIVVIQIVLGAWLALNDGTLPCFLAEVFPTRVRYSGFAISFNLANALFGGTAAGSPPRSST